MLRDSGLRDTRAAECRQKLGDGPEVFRLTSRTNLQSTVWAVWAKETGGAHQFGNYFYFKSDVGYAGGRQPQIGF